MINSQKVKDQLRENKAYFFKKYPIKTLALFGSVARNEENESSDIDILVEFNKNVGIEFIDLADELEKLLSNKVDLVSNKGIKNKYLQHIKRDLIYV